MGNTGGDWKGWKARPNNRANTWSGKVSPKKDRQEWKRNRNDRFNRQGRGSGSGDHGSDS
jgi:hypothetical protein